MSYMRDKRVDTELCIEREAQMSVYQVGGREESVWKWW